MIRLQRITTADADWYRFMERLMVQSFPPEEYRPLEQLRLYTDTKPAFHNNIVLDSDDTPVGFFTYWDFGTFCYGEHFAIDPARRNGGYGARVIERLCADLAPRPLVLEVEMPDNDLARRRIGFYQRQGFRLWDKPYRQPPYKPGDSFLPMLLMAYGALDADRAYDEVKQRIYREVYGTCPD